MNLFESIQKVVFGQGGKIKVSIPPCFSLLMTNKTDKTVYLFDRFSNKIGYPLLKGETLELEKIPEIATFYAVVEDQDTTDEKGLYIFCRPWLEPVKPIEENNTVIINKEKETEHA